MGKVLRFVVCVMGLATALWSTNAEARPMTKTGYGEQIRVGPRPAGGGRSVPLMIDAPKIHAAPELDPAGAAAVGLIVVAAGVIVLERRRRMA